MARGVQKDAWERASAVMALIANVNRDPKRHPEFKPADFNPFEARRDQRIQADITLLKAVFVDRRPPS